MSYTRATEARDAFRQAHENHKLALVALQEAQAAIPHDPLKVTAAVQDMQARAAELVSAAEILWTHLEEATTDAEKIGQARRKRPASPPSPPTSQDKK